jgi:hypothetical protein
VLLEEVLGRDVRGGDVEAGGPAEEHGGGSLRAACTTI